jgi:two-component system, NarL family, nitrate/nitrite response regulator NarL
MYEPDLPAPLRILVVAGYPSARAGLRAMLDGRDQIAVVGELSSLADLGEFAPGHADVLVVAFESDVPDLGVLELPAVLVGPDIESFGALRNGFAPGAMLLRDAAAADIAAAVRAVARGLVVLDPAVAAALAGPAKRSPASNSEVSLTARERAVLGLVALGLPNKGIARELGISEHTVKFHVGAVLGKLGAASRAEAVAMAARNGLLSL